MCVSAAEALKSWQTVISTYEFFLTTVNGKDLEPMLALAKALAKSPNADRLLANTSHETLGIRKEIEWWDVPHVTVHQMPDGAMLCQLWRKQTDQDILVSHQCSESEAEKVVLDLIDRLLAFGEKDET